MAEAELTSPAEVLAITFTRKAAGELRNRVLEQLAAAATAAPLGPAASSFDRTSRALAAAVLRRDAALGWHLLATPQQLNIRTIDSFCGELSRSMPLLAGGVGQRQPAEDASALYREAAERVLRELGGPDRSLDSALRCLLLHRDARVADCVALIAGMLAAREQWGQLVPLAADELTDDRLEGDIRQQLEQTLQNITESGLARAESALPVGWLEDAADFAARLSAEPGYGGNLSPLLPFAGRPAPPVATAADYERWLVLVNLVLTSEGKLRSSLGNNLLGFLLPKTAKPELQDLIARLREADGYGSGVAQLLCSLRDLPETSLSEDQWTVLKAVFHVLRRALIELEILFSANGTCDFTALSLTARQLLEADHNPLAEIQVPGLRLQHLLVDEMQDTSVGQYALFERLTHTWDGYSQTVFLVGDPKQSIYAFRQARVERFLNTQRTGRLGELPLGSLRLTANFRSQAELVHQFNGTFSAILPPPEELLTRAGSTLQTVEVPFTAAVPVRSASASPALHWHTRILDPGDRNLSSEDQAGSEAEADARSIRLAIEDFIARWTSTPGKSPSRPPRIAVLARNRAHLAPVITELNRADNRPPLAFRAVEIEVLNERPEVLDLLALTRALLHPGDRIAWLAILRSPVCGLGLADLLALTGEGPDADLTATLAHLVERRQHLLSPEGQQLLGRVWPTLQNALSTLGSTSLPTLVERTWRTLGADTFLDTNSLANARRYLLLLHELDAAGTLDLQTLQSRLQKLYAEASDPGAAVELMTIHKSKGLEWDLVLVPSLERGSGRADTELLRWFELEPSPDGHTPVVLAPVSAKGGEGSRLWRWLGKLTTEREVAESKRLFYVACTRAREELHLYGTAKRSKTGDLQNPLQSALQTPRSGSLLHAAWPAALPVFVDALEATRSITLLPAPAPENDVPQALQPLLAGHAEFGGSLALAASEADPQSSHTLDGFPISSPQPCIKRLPIGFDPLTQFLPETGPQLPYPPASRLRHAAPFTRPEGSFAARAFGNVVHRFLDLLTRRLEAGQSRDALAAELSHWMPRIHGACRAEGLAPSLCERESARVLRALQGTLLDPTGFWLLQPHEAAWTERSLRLLDGKEGGPPSTLRADRVFQAGATALSTGATHLWIVDFKTAEAGGRSPDAFLAGEQSKYADQLGSYARAWLAATRSELPVVLALFYPLLTRMVYWPFPPQSASEIE